MATIIRRLVSKKKKRFVDSENNFDLDLAYITPRIIAMGYPASQLESWYRNPATEVRRFLQVRHPNCYKLWSLTAEPERKYDKSIFEDRVEDKYQFWDHEAPPFEMIIPFCQSMDHWFQQHPNNVAVIHCKAGKGRTGVMICCYLLWSKHSLTADAALTYYAEQRTLNMKGVTIPSQRRSVHYLEHVLKHPNPNGPHLTPLPGQKLKLKQIRIAPVPIGGCTLVCFLYKHNFQMIGSSLKNEREKLPKYTDQDTEIVLPFSEFDLRLAKDVKFQFAQQQSEGKYKTFFHLWINLEFITNMKYVLKKNEIDKANKDKRNKKFSADFTVELEFEPLSAIVLPNPQ